MFDGGHVTRPRDAAASLAKLLDRELGTTIDPEKLHGFLWMHWDRISTLAHIVHEARVREGRAGAAGNYATQRQ
jgi:hypothetical protein